MPTYLLDDGAAVDAHFLARAQAFIAAQIPRILKLSFFPIDIMLRAPSFRSRPGAPRMPLAVDDASAPRRATLH